MTVWANSGETRKSFRRRYGEVIVLGSNITEILREKGFKVTPQRLAIYKILMETSKHPTAEVIFGELQSQYPTMSLATVYKTIEVLKEMGLVSSLNVGEDSFRYDANMEPHIHMICQECNEVTDLFGMDLSALNAAAEEKSGYQVVEHQVYLYGSCAECIRRRAN